MVNKFCVQIASQCCKSHLTIQAIYFHIEIDIIVLPKYQHACHQFNERDLVSVQYQNPSSISHLFWISPQCPQSCDGSDLQIQRELTECYNFPYWLFIISLSRREKILVVLCLTGRKQDEINAIFFITGSFGFLAAGNIQNDLFHTPKMSLIWQLNQSSWHTVIDKCYKILMQYPYFMLFDMTVTRIDWPIRNPIHKFNFTKYKYRYF